MPNIQTREGKVFADALLAVEQKKENIAQPNKPQPTVVDGTKNDVRDLFNKWIVTDENGVIVDHLGHA